MSIATHLGINNDNSSDTEDQTDLTTHLGITTEEQTETETETETKTKTDLTTFSPTIGNQTSEVVPDTKIPLEKVNIPENKENIPDINLKSVRELPENEENIPDINLKSVRELPEVLGNMKYEDLRKGLYRKYGLITKDEQSVPGLYMITYNKPDRNPRNKVVLSKEQQRVVSQYRGVIVEKDTNVPVCYTFDKMNRHFPDDWDLSDCKITASCDGSQIKVFYHKQEKSLGSFHYSQD